MGWEENSEAHGSLFQKIIEYNRFKNIVEIGVVADPKWLYITIENI